ncbi:MAG: NAD(P)-dependent oxidoreductase [Chloroflexi bacterium]|nr:NAD(P)-dependent oxidoreductase [Chloroflexota bacterium]
MQLGYIGTGTMGNPMAKALIEAGHTVTVHDLRRESATNLCEMGANWADSPRELAAASEVVFTSLPGPVEADQVLTDPDSGILAGLKRGGVWIDTTTNSPTVIHRLADICQQRGIEMLDSPVSGRIPNMTMMVGGDPAVFEKHRPVLETMGKDVIYVGETASGCTAKLVTQYLGYSNFVAGVEGMLIGAKAGLDMDILAKLIPISASASGVMNRSLEVLLDGTFASNGTLDIVAKDLHLACQLARDVQAPSRIGDIVDDVLQRAQAQGWGQEGYPIVAKVLEQMAGADIRSKSKA